MGALLMTQASSLAIIGSPAGTETNDVAFETLAGGNASQAVHDLEALRAQMPNDPALLINLGSAYAELGQADRAEQCYRAAMESDVRYELELADGSWVDSRRAARQALRDLTSENLALN
ncbi:tetratricopeptide repeat protein [Altererythrobacter aestuarii]|uniref:Tetratricopeptide repeat protein n=2 Tax=Alteraurantiacibacter aestuarii TaxID=650004 RepID=A0A844ZIL2_9SPHN|nr:tetratricopeptide repeat protein [Alteraurantiacibacter aestuarii]